MTIKNENNNGDENMLKIVCLTIFGAKITPPWPPRPRPPGVFTPVVNSPGREISPMVPSSKLRVCELENGLFIVETRGELKHGDFPKQTVSLPKGN